MAARSRSRPGRARRYANYLPAPTHWGPQGGGSWYIQFWWTEVGDGEVDEGGLVEGWWEEVDWWWQEDGREP